MDSSKITHEVQSRYSSIAKATTDPKYATNVAKAFGYSDEDLANIPQSANMGLGCGNPVATANVREGETIIDLGCGGGLDLLTLSPKLGPHGIAIGIDHNPDMLSKAAANAKTMGVTNVRFIECGLTKLTLRDGMADCVISNCVVNLVPGETEKQKAFDEIFRVLKPGGRVAISDILIRKKLTEEMKGCMALYVGCVAGAGEVGEYEKYMRNAGFEDVRIIDTKSDLNVYITAAKDSTGSGSGCCGTPSVDPSTCCDDPTSAFCCKPDEKSSCCGGSKKEDKSLAGVAKKIAEEIGEVDWNEWAGSFQIYALKPTKFV